MISRGSRVLPSAQQVHDLARLLPARLAATVYLAADCGLRMGEILGLEVDDIDFDAREVHVRRQHGLRHYYATVPIHAGASVKTVQLSLGHSTPTVTLNTYVHEWPDVLDRTRLLIDGPLGQ